MKSRRRFLHLSSFSDSNSFMTAGPGLFAFWRVEKRTSGDIKLSVNLPSSKDACVCTLHEDRGQSVIGLQSQCVGSSRQLRDARRSLPSDFVGCAPR